MMKRIGIILMWYCAMCMGITAKEGNPRVLQRGLAQSYGELYVYYNSRVCPMSTLACEFCQKVYGKNSYKGFTAEQVLTGFLFYYDDWRREPIIKVKGKVKGALGGGGKYVSLEDFYGEEGYKIAPLLEKRMRDAMNADEKVQLIGMVGRGDMFRIWPLKDAEGVLRWYSWTERLPMEVENEEWQFCRGAMDYAAMLIGEGKNVAANEVFVKIKQYQEKRAGAECLPTVQRFKAEQLYHRVDYTRWLAIVMATIGLLLFVIYCVRESVGKSLPKALRMGAMVLMGVVWISLSGMIGLRWYVGGHIPLSNGFEVMQGLAWCAGLVTLLGRSVKMMLPMGYLVCGMTLMVSMMSGANPQITNLMPVLQSPLLSVHVCVIMVSYCLLAFVMLNGMAALVVGRRREEVLKRAQEVSMALLYPAVFCLTAGIFIGAVWANVSWGRYWGWDPKEVWALVTLMVYAAPLHGKSLPKMREPRFFHVYCVLAFLSVLITYFGVNFVLGGMHGYAG